MESNKNHARAAKFVKAIARKLCDGKCESKIFSSLDTLLKQAVEDLPNGPIRETLESDLETYVTLLRQTMTKFQPELAKPVESLSTVCEKFAFCSLVTNEQFSKAAEAVIGAAENEAAGNDGKRLAEWITQCRRILCVRSNSPLALWWTYAGLELHQLSLESKTGNESSQPLHDIVSSAMTLVKRLKTLAVGRCHPFTAVAALAPVVAELFEAGCILASDTEFQTGSWRKAVKSLNSACKTVLGCISIFKSCKAAKPDIALSSKDVDAFSLDLRGLALAAEGIAKMTGRENNQKGVAKLFPLATESLQQKLVMQIQDTETCASVVSGEVFLMRLMVLILQQRSKSKCSATLVSPELRNELKFLAVQGIDFLVDYMMDSKLQVKPVLDKDEELLLKETLFDVIVQTPAVGDRPVLFMKKVVLAHRANEFYRSNGERSKALEVSSKLYSWKAPNALPEWLLSLKVEGQVPNNMLKDSCALSGWLKDPANEKAVTRIVSKSMSLGASQEATSELEDDAFYLDTGGDMGALEALDQEFMAAAEQIKTMGSNQNETPYSDSEDEDAEQSVNLDLSEEFEREADIIANLASKTNGVPLGKRDSSPDETSAETPLKKQRLE